MYRVNALSPSLASMAIFYPYLFTIFITSEFNKFYVEFNNFLSHHKAVDLGFYHLNSK